MTRRCCCTTATTSGASAPDGAGALRITDGADDEIRLPPGAARRRPGRASDSAAACGAEPIDLERAAVLEHLRRMDEELRLRPPRGQRRRRRPAPAWCGSTRASAVWPRRRTPKPTPTSFEDFDDSPDYFVGGPISRRRAGHADQPVSGGLRLGALRAHRLLLRVRQEGAGSVVLPGRLRRRPRLPDDHLRVRAPLTRSAPLLGAVGAQLLQPRRVDEPGLLRSAARHLLPRPHAGDLGGRMHPPGRQDGGRHRQGRRRPCRPGRPLVGRLRSRLRAHQDRHLRGRGFGRGADQLLLDDTAPCTGTRACRRPPTGKPARRAWTYPTGTTWRPTSASRRSSGSRSSKPRC